MTNSYNVIPHFLGCLGAAGAGHCNPLNQCQAQCRKIQANEAPIVVVGPSFDSRNRLGCLWVDLVWPRFSAKLLNLVGRIWTDDIWAPLGQALNALHWPTGFWSCIIVCHILSAKRHVCVSLPMLLLPIFAYLWNALLGCIDFRRHRRVAKQKFGV